MLTPILALLLSAHPAWVAWPNAEPGLPDCHKGHEHGDWGLVSMKAYEYFERLPHPCIKRDRISACNNDGKLAVGCEP